MRTPAEYREIPLTLPDNTITYVVGLASPKTYPQTPEEVFQFLKYKNVQIVYGLEASSEFVNIARRIDIEYIDETIPDFTAPSLELFDAVYDAVLSQAKSSKKIAIHCRGGIGRTGTLLAALKLKEMSMSESFYNTNNQKVVCMPSSSCSLNVSCVVDALRRTKGNEYVIETKEQIDQLCLYEKNLIERHFDRKNEEVQVFQMK